MPRNGRPVDETTRARAIELIKSGMISRNAIARELGLAGSTITLIAKAAGLEFDRTQTALAVAAAQVDLAVKRAELAKMFLVRAQEALEDMDAPTTTGHWSAASETRTASYDEDVTDTPTISDRRNLMTIAAIGIQRASDLTKASDGGGVAEGESVLMGLKAALHAAADAILEDPTEIPDPLQQGDE